MKNDWLLEHCPDAADRDPRIERKPVESEPKQPCVPVPELFTALARADSLRDSYQEIAWEIEGLAQLAGGTDPDDDVCDALAHLACAMKSLAAAREKALAEWAADGGAAPVAPEDDDIILVQRRHVEPEEKP